MSRALLIIDVQNDYFPGGTLPLHQAEETETRIVSAVNKAKGAGDRIILVRHVSQAKAGLFAAEGDGLAVRPAIVAAAGNAPIITKQFADAFQDTDLAKHLDGMDTLLVCGMMTQNCVVFTAMSQAVKGRDVCVVGDLCTAPLEIVHRNALNALKSKLQVHDAAEIWS